MSISFAGSEGSSIPSIYYHSIYGHQRYLSNIRINPKKAI